MVNVPTFSLPKDAEPLCQCLHDGGVILYPTEGVLGLGCDPCHQRAVERVKALKVRDPRKGLICVAAHWKQVSRWVDVNKVPDLSTILATWPGPTTWVFPASEHAPSWLQANASVALRISAHAIVQQICEVYGGPLVSTSANSSGEDAWCHYDDVHPDWLEQVDGCVDGTVGSSQGPSKIYDAVSQKQYR